MTGIGSCSVVEKNEPDGVGGQWLTVGELHRRVGWLAGWFRQKYNFNQPPEGEMWMEPKKPANLQPDSPALAASPSFLLSQSPALHHWSFVLSRCLPTLGMDI